MLLAVDAGNTNVTFAVFDGDALRSEWRTTTNASRTADDYAVWLVQLMALSGLRPDDIDEAIIATVVPQALFDLRTLCRRYFHCDPLVIGDDGVDLGIQNLARRPREVGADRLVNCVGAIAEFTGPLIVIDFGTATTFDIADTHGSYVGGVIAPGVNLNLEALHMASAKLPRIAVSVPDQVIGKDTVSAMLSGVYWGYIALIEGSVERDMGCRGDGLRFLVLADDKSSRIGRPGKANNVRLVQSFDIPALLKTFFKAFIEAMDI